MTTREYLSYMRRRREKKEDRVARRDELHKLVRGKLAYYDSLPKDFELRKKYRADNPDLTEYMRLVGRLAPEKRKLPYTPKDKVLFGEMMER